MKTEEMAKLVQWLWDFQRNCCADFAPDADAIRMMAISYAHGDDAWETAAEIQEGRWENP